MTYMSSKSKVKNSATMESADLYRLQDEVIGMFERMNDPQLSGAKLCGGTALSRCWLSHRLSYDLDFFLPEGFNAGRLAVALKRAGIDFEATDLVDGFDKANQLHGYVLLNGQRLKASFMEDAYFSLFPVQEAAMGVSTVRTEAVQGLYHRKLRTVSGHAAPGDSFEGGRQKARDLFDLYVLSQMVMPIRPFMASLPYAFPSAAFDNGLASMPWFDLMDELDEIICDPKWNHAKAVDFLQNALYAQIGASLIVDGSDHE